MKAPIGALVSLYYDGARFGRVVEVEHLLETPSGRRYLILEARRQERGKHAGRMHLRCLVVADVPPGATVHPLHWYRRGRSCRDL